MRVNISLHWPIARFWFVCFVFVSYRLCLLKWHPVKSRRPWNLHRLPPQEQGLIDTGEVRRKILGFVNRSFQFNSGFIFLWNSLAVKTVRPQGLREFGPSLEKFFSYVFSTFQFKPEIGHFSLFYHIVVLVKCPKMAIFNISPSRLLQRKL